MPISLEIINRTLSLLTIVGQLGVVVGIVSLPVKHQFTEKLLAVTTNYARQTALIVAVIATPGSLYYSEVAGYTPCKL